jgi:hypothetical protein
MYLADAVTALGVLDVLPDEWHTDEGFPVFRFNRAKVEEFRIRLSLCGYNVRVLMEIDPRVAPLEVKRRGRVMDISTGRKPAGQTGGPSK